MIFSENRCTLFGIMLRRAATAPPQNATRFAAWTKGAAAMRSIMIVLVAALALGSVALRAVQAQTPAPDSENGRYSFSAVPDGMLRLDTRTGAVSICAKQDAGWACNAVPDERTALENEIARLQRENGALKKDMLARNLPLPGGVTAPQTAQRTPQRELELKVPLPSDAEIDRMMTVFEKMWRRLVDMMQKTPGSDKI
jgi:hypothetical protein